MSHKDGDDGGGAGGGGDGDELILREKRGRDGE